MRGKCPGGLQRARKTKTLEKGDFGAKSMILLEFQVLGWILKDFGRFSTVKSISECSDRPETL